MITILIRGLYLTVFSHTKPVSNWWELIITLDWVWQAGSQSGSDVGRGSFEECPQKVKLVLQVSVMLATNIEEDLQGHRRTTEGGCLFP